MQRYSGIIFFFVLLLLSTIQWNGQCQQTQVLKIPLQEEFTNPSHVSVNGTLGKAISASENGRLLSLPSWNNGELITIFSPEIKDHHDRTDWYGEHAGKWLYATAIAASKQGNNRLKDLLLKTADRLISYQSPDGYLGNYAPEIRITNGDPSGHERSWDVWDLSYMTLGLLQVYYFFPEEKYLSAAEKIGELFLRTFGDGKNNITFFGTRHGISATVILDPVVELYKATGDSQYLDLAELVVREMEHKEGLKLVSAALHHRDMVNVGDGKAYQILWNLTGLTKLYEVTGNLNYLQSVENAWQNIADYHLTIAGGPWGGIGKHKECFNSRGFWEPYGFIETCSIMSWIQLNKELLHLTGEARYAGEIEKSAYNALLGAQYPNGQDWCYHSFSNGRRHVAHFNDCCPSSGALALEEVSSMVFSKKDGGIALNLYTPASAEVVLARSVKANLDVQTDYPFSGKILIHLKTSEKAAFPLFLRIPDWAEETEIRINDQLTDTDFPGKNKYVRIDRVWNRTNKIELHFPSGLKIVRRIEHATVPMGKEDIYRVEWYALKQGPLVFAINGLIFGSERERVFKIPDQNPESVFIKVNTTDKFHGPAYTLSLSGTNPVLFLPYYEAGGREAGTWRLTWVQNAID